MHFEIIWKVSSCIYLLNSFVSMSVKILLASFTNLMRILSDPCAELLCFNIAYASTDIFFTNFMKYRRSDAAFTVNYKEELSI